MTDTNVQRFKFAIPILKTSVKIVKDKDGNDVEERYVEGIASGTDLDKHGDRMAPSAIESMAKSLKQHVINLNVEHDTSWSGELGDITKLAVSVANELEIAAKLNKMSSANDLWYALTEQNKKLGLSIGGYVKDYEMVKEGEGDKAKWVRLYKDIELDHIAVTSRPAYPKTWVSVISKSISEDSDEKLIKKIEEEETSNLENEEKSRQSQRDTRIRELARAIARSIQKLEGDLLLELVYKGLLFLNEEQILLLERSLSMDQKDRSLEAEEAKKKAKSEDVAPEDKKDETLAAPEDEQAEDKESKEEDKEEETKEDKSSEDESSESESDESESEESGEGKDNESVKGEEAPESEEETEPEEEDSEPSEEESEEKSEDEKEAETTKAEDPELVKTVKELSKGLKEVLKGYEALQKKVESLETQPGDRKTIEVHKTVGDDGETEDKSVDELKKEMNKKIEQARKDQANNPNLFASIQRIRAEYALRMKNAQ